MPPRTYRDLTDEELDELAADFVPRAPVPPLPLGAQAAADDAWIDELADEPAPGGSRMEVGPIQMLGPGADDAWLDELIANPPQTPRRPTVSASGPGATFTGQDTPQARALIRDRGMQVTQQPPPSDDELLDALASERPATMPDLGDDEGWLDELIAQEGAAMDREQGAAPPRRPVAAAPRQTRADAVLESMAPPSRAQGIAAAIGDALFGGERMGAVHQRQRAFQNALAQARLQDIAAGERTDERTADREMIDARLGVTLRGQDLTDARARETRDAQRQLAEQTDRRIRDEGALGRDAAMERARLMAAAGDGPALTPEQESAGRAGYLAEQANTSEAEAQAYLAGKTEGLAPGKLERLRVTDNQFKTLSPRKRGDVIASGLARAGARRDQEEPKRLEARNALLAQHAAIKAASDAWKAMSPEAKQVMARLGGGDSTVARLARSAMLSDEDQARAAQVQALANVLIQARSGSSVPAGEWQRVAREIGLPEDAVSLFNSPASIEAWLKKSRDGFRQVRDSTLQTYRGLFDEVQP